jgi:hypothetical protein
MSHTDSYPHWHHPPMEQTGTPKPLAPSSTAPTEQKPSKNFGCLSVVKSMSLRSRRRCLFVGLATLVFYHRSSVCFWWQQAVCRSCGGCMRAADAAASGARAEVKANSTCVGLPIPVSAACASGRDAIVDAVYGRCVAITRWFLVRASTTTQQRGVAAGQREIRREEKPIFK